MWEYCKTQMKMQEEAIAPLCHSEQQEQQLKITFLQISSEFLLYTGNFSKLSNNLIASISFEEHQGFQTIQVLTDILNFFFKIAHLMPLFLPLHSVLLILPEDHALTKENWVTHTDN